MAVSGSGSVADMNRLEFVKLFVAVWLLLFTLTSTGCSQKMGCPDNLIGRLEGASVEQAIELFNEVGEVWELRSSLPDLLKLWEGEVDNGCDVRPELLMDSLFRLKLANLLVKAHVTGISDYPVSDALEYAREFVLSGSEEEILAAISVLYMSQASSDIAMVARAVEENSGNSRIVEAGIFFLHASCTEVGRKRADGFIERNPHLGNNERVVKLLELAHSTCAN